MLDNADLSWSQKRSWLKANRDLLTAQDCARVQSFLAGLPEGPPSRGAAGGVSEGPPSRGAAGGVSEGVPLRLRVARSIALETMVPFLEMFLTLAGWQATVVLGEFGQWRQELLGAGEHEVFWLVVGAEDLVSDLKQRPLRTPAEIEAAALEVTDSLFPYLEAALGRGVKRLAVNRFCAPPQPLPELAALAEAVNRRLAASSLPILWVGLDRVCQRVGAQAAFDYRYQQMASLPYARATLFGLARELAAGLLAHTGRRVKALVLDCDNTLWGGIVGELGRDIELGDNLPGIGFKDFQRVLLSYHGRGVMLAINSRNNPEDVLDILREHPHQLLKEAHFSAIELHWGDKAEALVRIARKLNVGLDSLVFIDDDPLQCARVATAHPLVTVIQQGESPLDVPFCLSGLDELQGAELTEEDLRRNEMMQQQRQREAVRTQLSLDDFYQGLGTRLDVFWDEPSHFERAVQLARKTNQFKLTPFVPQLQQLGQAGTQTVTCSLRDRFGDMGIIGVAVIALDGEDRSLARLDNVFLSCRALGRGVETALMRELLGALAAAGKTRVLASWAASQRNAQTRDYLPQCGFREIECDSNQERSFEIDLNHEPRPIGTEASGWIEVVAHPRHDP